MVSLRTSCTPARGSTNDVQSVGGTTLQPPTSVPEVFSSNWNCESLFLGSIFLTH